MTQPEEPMQESIQLERFPALQLKTTTSKGRGVFAGKPVPSGSTIDVCPVLVLDSSENTEHVEKTNLYNYTYNWPAADKATGQPIKTQAVIFGLGSMFNHSRHKQNVGWRRDTGNQVVIYHALRDIEEGEELCISYGDHLTFIDVDEPLANGLDEDENEVLGKIELNEVT